MRADVHCASYRDSLDARLDGELLPEEAREVDQHLATCAACARDYARLSDTHRLVSEKLMRYTAPDVLRARIRRELSEAALSRTARRGAPSWWRPAAAAVVIAVASSALTFAALGGERIGDRATDELLASHVRSLMPGHLTDVVSTDQHNVKPWFNGRVDVSPAVPDLSAAGFTLVGGRTDYVLGHAVPVVVYARRQHVINVYERADEGARASSAPRELTRNGYHFVTWRRDGMEYRAVSDLNAKELDAFVAAFTTTR